MTIELTTAKLSPLGALKYSRVNWLIVYFIAWHEGEAAELLHDMKVKPLSFTPILFYMQCPKVVAADTYVDVYALNILDTKSH